MKSVVLEIKNDKAALLDDNGIVHAVKNKDYKVGQVLYLTEFEIRRDEVSPAKRHSAFIRTAAAILAVAVIGGGLTGCEIAYELALQGKHPVIIEMKDDLVSQTGVCLANSSYLREWFALHKTPVYLETAVKEVRDGSVVCKTKNGDITIECDSVISSVGYIPNPIAPEKGGVHLVGDCRQIGNLRSVIWNAYETAMKI